jgi:hypothetical protein
MIRLATMSSLLVLRHFPVAPAMSQAATTGSVNVGSMVRITRVRDRISAEMVEALKADPICTVTGFRTVDGKGIGVVVQLANGQQAWFFEDEIALA